MDEFVNIIVNNGVAIAVVGYYMFRDYKFMTTLQVTLTTLVEVIRELKEITNGKNSTGVDK